MKIGILGSGMIGGTLAGLLVRAGHEVWVANTRGPASLSDLVDPLGPSAHPAGIEEAAAAGDPLVVVAVPVAAYASLPTGPLAGKVLVDTGNYAPSRDGRIAELEVGTWTSSKMLAAQVPRARVVKMFNTIYYADLRDQGRPSGSPDRRALPMAGDDATAKALVAELVDQIGFDTVDTGPLATGRSFQPGSAVYNVRLDALALASALL